jgi:hypothetical protein
MGVRTSMAECLTLFLFQIGIVDPDCRLIGLHLYDGHFKVCLVSQAFDVQVLLKYVLILYTSVVGFVFVVATI